MKAAVVALLVVGAAGADLNARIRQLEAEVLTLKQQVKPVATGSDAQCSGRGFYYEDIEGCACFPCFEGADCKTEQNPCMLADTGGTPCLYEEYWRTTPAFQTKEAVYYRSPYQWGNSVTLANRKALTESGLLLPTLRDTIVRLHQKVNNIADPEKKNLVIGSGGTELIGAVTYACKKMFGRGKQMYVYAKTPYYSGYPTNFVGFGVEGLQWTDKEDLDPSQVIEFVTYPNNPTNEFRQPVYKNNAACTVHDQVYWWPSLNNMTEGGAPLRTKISLFSMSKLTGHAGTRLGWALVDNAPLAELMDEYVNNVQIHVSIDAQYRTNTVLNYLMDVDNLNFFSWAKQHFAKRWEQINAVFDPRTQNRFTQLSKSGGFYAWVRCNNATEATSCAELFRQTFVNPSPGPAFGGSSAYVRLELVLPTPTWDLMIPRLQKLVQRLL